MKTITKPPSLSRSRVRPSGLVNDGLNSLPAGEFKVFACPQPIWRKCGHWGQIRTILQITAPTAPTATRAPQLLLGQGYAEAKP